MLISIPLNPEIERENPRVCKRTEGFRLSINRRRRQPPPPDPLTPDSLFAIFVNTEFKLPPTVVTAVTMTTAIRPAIKPYSMAVAPDSSFRNLAIIGFFLAQEITLEKCQRTATKHLT